MKVSLNRDIYEKWKEVCGELNKVDRIMLNLKFTDYLFKFKYIRLLRKQHEELNIKWHLYFDLIQDHKILDQMDKDFVALPKNNNTDQEWL